jgi:hypothetical protein
MITSDFQISSDKQSWLVHPRRLTGNVVIGTIEATVLGGGQMQVAIIYPHRGINEGVHWPYTFSLGLSESVLASVELRYICAAVGRFPIS